MSKPFLVPRKDIPIETRFHLLADEWHAATDMLSSPRETAMHATYQQIIGMGAEALPFIFEDIHNGWWFWALVAITGEDPAAGTTTHKDAVDKWEKWYSENK